MRGKWLRGALLALAVVASVVVLTRPVVAHEAAVLDLEGIETHLYEGTVDPLQPPLLHGAYARLLDRFDVASDGLLSNDVHKLLLCAKACEGALGVDEDLVTLTDLAATQAADSLVGENDDLAEVVLRIHSAKKGKKVLRRAAAADRLRARGVTKGAAGKRVKMLATFRRSALRFEAARDTAARILERQRRKPAPGQPLPKGATGTIDTYVGNGLRGYDGEDFRARETALYWPLDVAVGPYDGLLYVCDSNNHRVRRVDSDGRLRTVVGSGYLGASEGPALEADIHHPSELAFIPGSEKLVIAGWHSEVVHLLDPVTGVVKFAAGSHYGDSGDGGPVADALFSYPVDVVVDDEGDWYVSDQANRRVRRVDGATGIVTTLAGTGAAGDAGDGGPAVDALLGLEAGDNLDAGGKLCLDPTETILYVADTENHRVRGIDLTDGTIFAVAGTGTPGLAGDGGAATGAELRFPADVDCDADGNLYVADRGNHVVRRVDHATGVITTFAGTGEAGYRGDRGPAALARLDTPGGVHVDRARGRVFIADTGNSVVRVVWE